MNSVKVDTLVVLKENQCWRKMKQRKFKMQMKLFIIHLARNGSENFHDEVIHFLDQI